MAKEKPIRAAPGSSRSAEGKVMVIIKLGSLFDGIGGFPYAGTLLGIKPIWASEIESFPIRVTEHHFPNMKHLGDITKINGAEIEPVDIITFGSPCQDLSVAGKREGLAGERSGLFMEAVRIIREMRTATDGQYPRFAVWENVPGAFSSNKGQDFRAVLEEIGNAEIPMPKSGRWATAGMVRTETADIAWRVLDAQYWGVPQRRRRIFLVADFGGQCAGEILFKPEGLSRYSQESGETRQEVAATTRDGVEGTIFAIAFGGAREQNVSSPLMANEGPNRHQGFSNTQFDAVCIRMREDGDPSFTLQEAHSHAVCCRYVATASYWDGGQISDCLDCSMLAKGQMMPEKRRFPAVVLADQGGSVMSVHDDISLTLDSLGNHAICLQGSMIGRADKNGPQGDGVNEEVSFMLNTTDRHAVATADCRNHCENKELSGTPQSKPNGGHSLNYQNPVRIGYAVRRLTPLECLRLQGFPDYWLDIEGMSDTQKYKAVGNSVAIPCVMFVLSGITRVLRPEGRWER